MLPRKIDHHSIAFNMPLTINEKIEIVNLARGMNYRETAHFFNRTHPNHRPITKNTVWHIFRELTAKGGFQRKKRNESIERITEHEDLKENIFQLFSDNPHLSTRKAAIRLGVGHATVWRILKEFKFKPYKMAKHQKLQPDDPPKRKEFCTQLKRMFDADREFSKTILWTDEKMFEMNGCFNRQNFRYKHSYFLFVSFEVILFFEFIIPFNEKTFIIDLIELLF